MPIYEYKCKSCGARFEEIIVPCNKDKKTVCPGCSCKNVEKTVSKFATKNSSTGCGGGCPSCGGCG